MTIERVYVVPLRKEWLKVSKYQRSKKAVTALREFIVKHMKSEDVKLGNYVNLEIWKHGIKNPPHKVKVNVKKNDEGTVFVELVGAPVEEVKEEKTEKKKKETKKAEKNEDTKIEAKKQIADEVKEVLEGKEEKRVKKEPVKVTKKDEADIKDALKGDE